MKRLIITEEEKETILKKHKKEGYKSIEEDEFDDLVDADVDIEQERDDLEQGDY